MKPRYGSEARPAVVVYYLIVDKQGDHQFLSLNDYALAERFGNIDGYEEHLRSRYSFVERIGIVNVVMEGNVGSVGADGAALKDRINELRRLYPDAETKMWMPDGEAPVLTSARTIMIEALASAIHKHVRPTIVSRDTGETCTVENGFLWIRATKRQFAQLLAQQPTEAIEAVGVYFIDQPPAMLDARVSVTFTGSAGTSSSVLSCTAPSWRLTELAEPFDALHALHLLWRPDGIDDQFVLAENRGGGFRCMGWLEHEKAKQWALAGKAKDSGRPPDFKGAVPTDPGDEKD